MCACERRPRMEHWQRSHSPVWFWRPHELDCRTSWWGQYSKPSVCAQSEYVRATAKLVVVGMQPAADLHRHHRLL